MPIDDDTIFDKDPQDPETIASGILAAEVDDTVRVFASGDDDDEMTIYEGHVVGTDYREAAADPDPDDFGDGGTHRLQIDVVGKRIVVRFDRVINFDADGNLRIDGPTPEVVETASGRTTPVTRFEWVDG